MRRLIDIADRRFVLREMAVQPSDIEWRKETGGGYWIGAWYGKFVSAFSKRPWLIQFNERRLGWELVFAPVRENELGRQDTTDELDHRDALSVYLTVFQGIRDFLTEIRPPRLRLVIKRPDMQPIVTTLLRQLADRFQRMGYAVEGTSLVRIRNQQ